MTSPGSTSVGASAGSWSTNRQVSIQNLRVLSKDSKAMGDANTLGRTFTQPLGGAVDLLPMRNPGRPTYVRLGRLHSRTPLADQIAAPESGARGCSATRQGHRDSGYGCAVPNCSLHSVAEQTAQGLSGRYCS